MELQKKIAIWGDSVLKGIVLNPQGKYEVLEKNCADSIKNKFGLSIQNKARFGCTIEKGYNQLKQAIKSGFHCDYVVLEFGGNDCDFKWKEVSDNPNFTHSPRTLLPQFSKVYREMISMLRKNSIEPILVSLPPVSGEKYINYLVSRGLSRENLLEFLGDYNMIYRFHELYSLYVTKLAHQENCIYAPVREEFLKQWHQPDYLCADGIHPNSKGHALMQKVFENLTVEMQKKVYAY